jgi:hypothetical protein
MRKKRFGEFTCNCQAYHFPHRFGGGRCSGIHLVEDTFYSKSDFCLHCVENTPYGCAVVDGRESPKECPAYQDLVEREEVKIYSKRPNRTLKL